MRFFLKFLSVYPWLIDIHPTSFYLYKHYVILYHRKPMLRPPIYWSLAGIGSTYWNIKLLRYLLWYMTLLNEYMNNSSKLSWYCLTKYITYAISDSFSQYLHLDILLLFYSKNVNKYVLQSRKIRNIVNETFFSAYSVNKKNTDTRLLDVKLNNLYNYDTLLWYV